ncbi:MAG: hypothetical protein COA45_04780 [Zetaproteobacteria bacterium]|nr:MAG: hypothetical protein COA45_04780 [Zetaproteobacteria bacterium]
MPHSTNHKNQYQSGNVLFIILLAVALIGALTVAIQGTSQQSGHIDKETLILRVSEIQRYAAELERGVNFIMQNGYSENDIRFSHPNAHSDYGDLGADSDKSDQMFDRIGGAAYYRTPPKGINDGSAWEFYGHTALPHVGSDRAELIVVLPNITQAFCERINNIIGYDATQPTDSSTCIHGGAAQRFDNTTQFPSSPNTVTDTTFSIKPSVQGCVQCSSDNSYHFFYVLMSR